MKKLFIILSLLSSTMARAADTTNFVLKRLSPLPQKSNELTNVKLDLNGSWLFDPNPETGFEKQNSIDASWKKITVPGEWLMQGFKVEKDKWAGYTRNFTLPQNWQGKRVKLRCDGVYSECTIYVNGKKIGSHLGGFTPFEFDITDEVKPGTESVIKIKVRNESVADSLASGSQYAVHELGGITRKIYLMAVPDINISSFHVATTFDKAYKNAVLTTQLQIANESAKAVNAHSFLFELLSDKSGEVILSKKITSNTIVKSGNALNESFEFPVAEPYKWDPEHPNLYRWRVTLQTEGTSEVAERKIGFRQIEVRGNRVYVNNYPIKLRGACRHEVSPLQGRSLTGDQWTRDVELFREENVNYIRTSHYPPPEEFVHACDSLGMFLEVEAPFCWADQTNVPDSLYRSAILDQTLDMVNFYRSNPAVLDWSIANESQSAYDRYFKRSAALVKKIDPTRPRTYNQYGDEDDHGELEIGNQHYPGPGGPSKYKNNTRPMMFGEYTHLNAYNRLELVTDPGLRDAWGIGFKNMWEAMYNTPAILGGCIWAGIDDTFILPDGKVVGYGTWGPLDGWRRKKPEYWHVKKAYSPIKIQLTGNYENNSVKFLLENRFLFSSLNECKIKWHIAKSSGEVSSTLAPGEKGDATIHISGAVSGADTLFIDVYDPRKVLINQYAFAVLPEVAKTSTAHFAGKPFQYQQVKNIVTANVADVKIVLDTNSGKLSLTKNAAAETALQLPVLMLLPLNPDGRGTQMTGESQTFAPFTPVCTNRVVQKITYTCQPEKFVVTIKDEYDEASGSVTYEFAADKQAVVSYHYTVKKALNPRQWGMVFSFSNDFNEISWKRNGLWNYYPNDHIGRLSGSAYAFSAEPISGPAGPVQKPDLSWSADRTDLGTNDFRSTKMNFTSGVIKGKHMMVNFASDGSQHMRAWKQDQQTRVLIAGYSNLGDERFFRGHAELFDQPLKQGNTIADHISFSIK